MNYPLSGKVALITGGSSGIGKAIADRFTENGAAVVICDVSPKGEQLANEWQQAGKKVEFAQVDVRQTADLERAVSLAEERFGGLDILVNCAGIFPRATLADTTDALWDQIMDVNLKGVFHTCQVAVPALIRRGSGVIINIGSLNTFGGTPELFAYSTSKGGVATLTRNLARTFAKHKIRVNCVHPGWVATEGEMAVQQQQGMPDNWVETEGHRLPMGRVQTPDDIAAAVLFLASDDANQITGQFLTVDGGLSFRY